MAKQISLTFKENDRELELYNWLQAKVSKGTFIKEQLLVSMQNEKQGTHSTYTDTKQIANTSTNDKIIINKDFSSDEVEEF